MRLKFKTREFEIDNEDLSRLVIEEYKGIMKEQEKRGFITLDYGLFGVLDGFFGSKGSAEIPKCIACGSFEDYTGRCRYSSAVKVIQESGEALNLCKKDDLPIRNLIEKGKLNKYKIERR